jgi:hypothetical protein
VNNLSVGEMIRVVLFIFPINTHNLHVAGLPFSMDELGE